MHHQQAILLPHDQVRATIHKVTKRSPKPVTPQSKSLFLPEEDRTQTEDTNTRYTTTTISPGHVFGIKDDDIGWARETVRIRTDWLEDTDEEIDEQELEAHYSYMAKIQEVSPEESSSTSQPLEQVQNHDENEVFWPNVRRHSEQT
ncbi:hypothetical protein Tco_0685417 [Tanacetum coccineum]